jgi:hypothetical protein
MKRLANVCCLISVFIVLNSTAGEFKSVKEKILFQAKDKEIAEQVIKQFSAGKNLSTAELVIKIGLFFKETPYVAHTLEAEPEQLVVNLRELDCTTFAESSLALALTIKNGNPTFEKYCATLQDLRYYNGEITNYTSRIHYFSDWIFENNKRGFITDVSGEIGQTSYSLNVGFMSTHPESYRQLAGNSSFVTIIAEKEKQIAMRKMFYIPEEKLAEKEQLLKDGDIVGITTSMKGLDISHVGILVRKNNRIHLLNASSISMKVELTEETLEEYLKHSKSSTGIMVVRPK